MKQTIIGVIYLIILGLVSALFKQLDFYHLVSFLAFWMAIDLKYSNHA